MNSDEIPLAIWPPVQGRSCGECSACCGPAMPIKFPDLKKAYGQWCPNCASGGGGCTIYETRPSGCRDFACAWLRGLLPDELHPLHVGAVISEYRTPTGQLEFGVQVDP